MLDILDTLLELGGVDTDCSDLISSMHPRQLAFFTDPRKAKAVCAARQSGKTYGVGLWLVSDWKKHPGQISVYVTKTAKAAQHRLWPQLKAICKQFRIPFRTNESDLILTFPNGYRIWCTGCKDRNEADKIRGEAFGFVKIALDEPATFHDDLLEYFCTEVAEWTLMQTRGDLVLCGTPGAIPQGFWYDICHNEEWGRHVFTALDNPFIPDARQQLEAFKKKYGYTDTTPKVRREFFAQWVLDTDSLVYLTSREDFLENNGYWELPINPKIKPFDLTILGIDFGYAPDPCAFTIASTWRDRPEIYIRRSYTKEKLTPDLIAAEARMLRKDWGVHRIVVDAGGGGKTTAAALQHSYGLPVEETAKGVKRPKIDMMRGAINSHNLKVHLKDAQELFAEYQTIVWDDDHEKHNDLCSDHNADAAIQACLLQKQFAVSEWIPEIKSDPTVTPEKQAAFERASQAESDDD